MRCVVNREGLWTPRSFSHCSSAGEEGACRARTGIFALAWGTATTFGCQAIDRRPRVGEVQRLYDVFDRPALLRPTPNRARSAVRSAVRKRVPPQTGRRSRLIAGAKRFPCLESKFPIFEVGVAYISYQQWEPIIRHVCLDSAASNPRC